jgi:hypothetical protein
MGALRKFQLEVHGGPGDYVRDPDDPPSRDRSEQPGIGAPGFEHSVGMWQRRHL